MYCVACTVSFAQKRFGSFHRDVLESARGLSVGFEFFRSSDKTEGTVSNMYSIYIYIYRFNAQGGSGMKKNREARRLLY